MINVLKTDSSSAFESFLPKDCITHVIKFVDCDQDLATLRLVNKQFKNIVDRGEKYLFSPVSLKAKIIYKNRLEVEKICSKITEIKNQTSKIAIKFVFTVIKINAVIRWVFMRLKRFIIDKVSLPSCVSAKVKYLCSKTEKIEKFFLLICKCLKIIEVKNKFKEIIVNTEVAKTIFKINGLFDLEKKYMCVLQPKFCEVDADSLSLILLLPFNHRIYFEKAQKAKSDCLVLKRLFQDPKKFYELPFVDGGVLKRSKLMDFVDINKIRAPVMRGTVDVRNRKCDFFTLRGKFCKPNQVNYDHSIEVIDIFINLTPGAWVSYCSKLYVLNGNAELTFLSHDGEVDEKKLEIYKTLIENKRGLDEFLENNQYVCLD